MSTEDNALDFALCRECGGRCCQGSPGVWIDPERFFAIFFAGKQLTIDRLRERLPDLELVLWQNSGTPIPAPRSLITGCTFLGTDGCSLHLSDRPCQCLALIPTRGTLAQKQGCLCRLPDEYSRKVAEQRWQEYWKKDVNIPEEPS